MTNTKSNAIRSMSRYLLFLIIVCFSVIPTAAQLDKSNSLSGVNNGSRSNFNIMENTKMDSLLSVEVSRTVSLQDTLKKTNAGSNQIKVKQPENKENTKDNVNNFFEGKKSPATELKATKIRNVVGKDSAPH